MYELSDVSDLSDVYDVSECSEVSEFLNLMSLFYFLDFLNVLNVPNVPNFRIRIRIPFRTPESSRARESTVLLQSLGSGDGLGADLQTETN